MTNTLILDPIVPLTIVYALAALSILGVGFAAWRKLNGWWLRGLAALAMLGAVANPSLLREDRIPLSDIVIALVDETASQNLSDRTDQTAQALAKLQIEIAKFKNTDLRVVTVPNGDGDAGTQLMTALATTLTEEPQGRIAGIITLTDGRLHDIERTPPLPAPLHTLLSGRDTDWDRRLTVTNAPPFAILGETVTLTLRIDDQGAAPLADAVVALSISIDGNAPATFQVPVGQDIELPLDLPHGGMNVVQFMTPTADGELTDQNNAAIVQINGVRDRLRVLLVSGEPHPGERTWRNLLKSDAGVDLVHFTILRPPGKQDGVPVDELSLIAFPTRELFLEKINDFDLIIFDRYRRRGILPATYFNSITDYVTNGGAVLISSGPEYGGAESIYRSPLGKILPGAPTARVFEEGFTPQITDLGARHPVTKGLDQLSPNPDSEGPGWGRWFRLVDVIVPDTAKIVMSGLDDRPLLTLDRIGAGRVALITSDQSWLWDRGFEGGGPQLELLRRLAHWMMKEPDLEEEALSAEARGQSMRIIRRTLKDTVGDVTVTHPDGSQTIVALNKISPGRFETVWTAPDVGLYRLTESDKTTVIALGPAAPREFEQTIASGNTLRPIVATTRGGTLAMADNDFAVRSVRAGRPAAGRGWIGITPRGAYQTSDISSKPILPAWAFLLLTAMLTIAAWMREGRKTD